MVVVLDSFKVSSLACLGIASQRAYLRVGKGCIVFCKIPIVS